MYNLNSIMESAIIEVVNRHMEEILKQIEFKIEPEEIEKVVKSKEMYLINRISEILSEDIDAYDATEKIKMLFEENKIECGVGRNG